MNIWLKQLHPIIGFIMAIYLFSGGSAHAGEPDIISVGEFSQNRLDQWLPKQFVNETQYSLAMVDKDRVLKAVSRNSASGLIKKIRVDLETHPFLNWRWRIGNRLTGIFDEKQKSGDDYAARIYVVVSGGIAIWNTRALNYVWAQNSPKGDTWPNAFAKSNAVMMALRSSEAPISVWQTEKRNIREDFKKLFGKQIRYIDAVVLMSDTDNTKKQVTAYYGDIYFSMQ
ncbi:MAG: DUF3047 domain-containing protein [Proteobacteria bacterium]|nr:DUF3047 domain-containing protein [Pseudomonadota bacterium]MBU1583350.1 DUF3047 domain-containing protein [Pseudomonadota bacterium]MBU2631368.1 DUF3047 domain-containing protein [Pseudomonadota bacterium]